MGAPTDPDHPQPSQPQEPPPLSVGGPPGAGGAFELPEGLAFLRNRLILGGLGLLAVLLLTAIVLVLIGGSSEDKNAAAAREPTPETVTPGPEGDGLTGRINNTATMRIGPGEGYPIVGTIPEGTLLVIAGRNEDSTWLQVIYPPGSQLRGWVPIEFVDVTGDIGELVVAGPGDTPDVVLPTDVIIITPYTSTPVPFTPARPTRVRVATATPLPPTATLAPPTPTVPPPPPTQTPPGQGQNQRSVRFP